MNWSVLLDEAAVAALLSADDAHFAKPVCDGLAVFLQGLPESRQAAILAQQAAMSPTATVAERLGSLAQHCPVLQKIGQVLARDQRLSPELRQQLRQLESLAPTVPLSTIQTILQQEFGSLDQLGITLTPPALAEASVAVVVPFTKQSDPKPLQGVFKILKPGIEGILEHELGLLESVGAHLDERCDELRIPHLDYQEAFQQVRDKFAEEVRLEEEQRKLAAARVFYAGESRVHIPALFDCCSSRVTAMERIWGDKVTDHQFTDQVDKYRLAELIVETMIARPIFAKQNRALFHSDPHAGNLFLTNKNRLAILDWSLVGWLGTPERVAIVQVMLGAVTLDERRIVEVLTEMATRDGLNQPELKRIVKTWLRKLWRGQFPGLTWLIGMLDEAVRDAGLRLKADLMMFRKTLYTLEGVVAEVGVREDALDKVLWAGFLQHIAMEWPSRWFAAPNTRNFSTHLSNFDLTQAILGSPLAAIRFWKEQSLDLWNSWSTASKATS